MSESPSASLSHAHLHMVRLGPSESDLNMGALLEAVQLFQRAKTTDDFMIAPCKDEQQTLSNPMSLQLWLPLVLLV